MKTHKPVLNLEIDKQQLRDLKILITQNKYNDLRLYFKKMGISPNVYIECKSARELFIYALQSKKMCRILLDTGFSPNAKTDEKIPSVLWLAIHHRSINLATLLIERGANSSCFLKDNIDATFGALCHLDITKSEKHRRFFSYLVSVNGQDWATMKNPNGDTALFFLMRRITGVGGIFAIKKEAEYLIKNNMRFLISKGASPFVADTMGRTFMDMIEEKRKNILSGSYLIEEMRDSELNNVEKITEFVHELHTQYISLEKENLKSSMKVVGVKNNTLEKRI